MFYALFFLFIAADFLRPIEPPEKPEAAITMLDIATDFRGIKFRSKPNLGKGYFFYEKDGDTLVYRKAKDYMNVNGIPVDDVYYVFWEKKFLGGVMLCYTADDCLEPLYEMLSPKLGEGYLKEGSERVVWFGDNAYLILKREDDGTGRLMMFDRETVLEIKRAPVEGL
mgnify:CR=1 FL=1|jgi:hypothetical protein|tara:strand:+ start:306 stop:809 length:504 start_codon:yes stop_codon:yes gene_type:complete